MLKYFLSNNSQEVNGLPNIKNAVKRVRTTKTKTLINSARKSLLKSTIKNAMKLLQIMMLMLPMH